MVLNKKSENHIQTLNSDELIDTVGIIKNKLYLVRLACVGFCNSFACVAKTEQEVSKREDEMYKYDYFVINNSKNRL